MLSCPSCTGEILFLGVRGDVSLHGCGACGGVWVDNELASRIVKRIVSEAVALADLAGAHRTPFPEAKERPFCPECARDLQRVRLEGTTIELDICRDHGTWFDPGELQLVTKHFEARRATATAVPFPPPLHFDPAQYPGGAEQSTLGAVGVGVAGGVIEFFFEAVVESIVD